MTKSWRPDDWEEIKSRILPLRFESLDPEPFRFIEAGADAMLEALFRMAKASPTGTFTIEGKAINIFKGKLNDR